MMIFRFIVKHPPQKTKQRFLSAPASPAIRHARKACPLRPGFQDLLQHENDALGKIPGIAGHDG